MSPVRRSRRVAATARTRGNGQGNNPLVDLTNRGGAAQSSGANKGVKATRGRRANGVGAREGNPRGVKREATSSEGRTRKKTKKDDFTCEETMPETRETDDDDARAATRAVPSDARGMVATNSEDYPFSVCGGRRRQELIKENVLAPYVGDGRYFNVATRQQLIDWMADQHNSMSLTDETLHLAIVYMDTFLTQRVPDTFLQRSGASGSEPLEAKPLRALGGDRVLHSVDMQHPLCNKLKRLGITCIFVAAKVTEVMTPTANEFATYAEVSSFTRDQLLLAERALLRELKYALIRPTAFGFAEAYVESVLRTTNQLRKFPDRIEFANCAFAHYGDVAACFKETTYYLVELAKYGHEGLRFTPSLIAAASVAASLRYLDIKWDEIPILEEVAGYNWEQLGEACDYLRRVARDAQMIEEWSDGLTVNSKYEGVTSFVFSTINSEP